MFPLHSFRSVSSLSTSSITVWREVSFWCGIFQRRHSYLEYKSNCCRTSKHARSWWASARPPTPSFILRTFKNKQDKSEPTGVQPRAASRCSGDAEGASGSTEVARKLLSCLLWKHRWERKEGLRDGGFGQASSSWMENRPKSWASDRKQRNERTGFRLSASTLTTFSLKNHAVLKVVCQRAFKKCTLL